MKSAAKYFPFVVFAVLYAIVCFIIFHFIDEPPKSDDINLVNRGIDSSIRLWLNGYLGLFFGFKFLGVINWLVIPFIVFFIFSERNIPRWIYALLFFYFAALLLIVSQGYFNSRYQITLLPLTISIVVFLAWFFSEKKEWNEGKYFLMALFFAFTIYNDSKYFMYHKPKQGDLLSKSETTANTHNYGRWLNPLPAHLVDFIAQLQVNDSAKVLVNNVPFYFYYTNKPGVYCWSEDDVYYDSDGVKPMMKDRRGKSFSDFLLNELHCRYIVTASSYAGYSKTFDEYVAGYCELIFNDSNGYLLYEVKAD